jgi:hypothetical protein
VTKREWDQETKIEDRTRLMSASQYRRDRRGHVPAWIHDWLLTRKPGWVLLFALRRALVTGRATSAQRDRLYRLEGAR